ncbi:helix-turn-helix domain-containing protein [Camelimonas abortus]|uniref:Helix-turn-helix domain-containing protein n=1 Tax=Camelimonas abortus TaxID=1017184 RepID=A0ABV7LEX7_9HYPH
MQDGVLTIGELARRAGSNVETVRYYERIGMLPAPARSAANYRLYDHGHLRRLNFILRARRLGFSLEQVRALLELAGRAGAPCAAVHDIARAHRDEIDRKIADLAALRAELDGLLAHAHAGVIGECRIIEALSPELDGAAAP